MTRGPEKKTHLPKLPPTNHHLWNRESSVYPKRGTAQAKAKDNNNRKNVLTFVSTHNPNNPNLFPIIKSTLPLLCASKRMKTSIKNKKLINSKRAPSNLKKMLTRARFALHGKEGPQITKCSNPLCGTCAHL